MPPQTRLQTQSAQAGLGWPGPFGEALAPRRSRGVLVGGLACGGVLLLLLVNPFGSSTPVPELVETGAQSITGGSVATKMSDVPTQDEALVQVGNAAALTVLINNTQTKPLGRDGQVVTMRINHESYRSYFPDHL